MQLKAQDNKRAVSSDLFQDYLWSSRMNVHAQLEQNRPSSEYKQPTCFYSSRFFFIFHCFLWYFQTATSASSLTNVWLNSLKLIKFMFIRILSTTQQGDSFPFIRFIVCSHDQSACTCLWICFAVAFLNTDKKYSWVSL